MLQGRILRENLAFYPFLKKKFAICPCFETRFYQNRVMPDQTKKKKKSMELKFQNAIIGLKNVTVGLPEPGMGRSHLEKKNFVGKRHYRAPLTPKKFA